MKQAIFIALAFMLPLFAAAQQASGQSQYRVVDSKVEYLPNADSTKIIMRVTIVQEMELSDEQADQQAAEIDAQAAQQQRVIDGLNEQKRRLLSIKGISLFARNRKNKTLKP